ncbi:hypothetical protein BU17DRAFT_68839 [Hysterangium stoloniferum]|nr:hypothetical protein BU17DRAFT_68839 [Hysterangium stoloniferum]
MPDQVVCRYSRTRQKRVQTCAQNIHKKAAVEVVVDDVPFTSAHRSEFETTLPLRVEFFVVSDSFSAKRNVHLKRVELERSRRKVLPKATKPLFILCRTRGVHTGKIWICRFLVLSLPTLKRRTQLEEKDTRDQGQISERQNPRSNVEDVHQKIGISIATENHGLIEEPSVPEARMQSSRNQVSNASLKRITESWDDDYEFHGNTNHHKSRSTGTPAETWDDANEDGPTSNHKSNQSIIPPKPPGTDEEVDSWGSGSDWSGDGDVEDLTRDSFPRTTVDSTLERQSTSSSRSTRPHDTGYSAATHSPFASPTSNVTPIRSPTSGSFFSRISPVRKWKVRDDRTPKAPPSQAAKQEKKDGLKEKGYGNGEKKNGDKSSTGMGSKFIKKRDSKAQIADAPSQRKESSPLTSPHSAFSAPKKSNMSSPVSTKHPRPFIPAPVPSSHSTTSPASPQTRTSLLPLAIPGSKSRSRSSTTSTPLPKPPPSSVSSSAHNTPFASNPNSSPTSHIKPSSNMPHLRLSQTTPRRSSLGDLKLRIPERISRAQRDIKRDMGDVKEFAACVEPNEMLTPGHFLFVITELQNLQHVYAIMLRNLRAVLSESSLETASITSTPITLPARTAPFPPKKRRETLFTLSPSPSSSSHSSPHKHANQNPKFTKRKFSLSLAASPPKFFLAPTPPPGPEATPYAAALDRLDATYGIWWECAEVLIELGGRRDPEGVDHWDRDWDWDWDMDGDTDVGVEAGAGARAGVSGGRGRGLEGLGLAAGMTRGKRPRAVTLGAGEEGMMIGTAAAGVSPPIMIDSDSGSGPPRASPRKPAQWRATTGRRKGSARELTTRQVALLRGMLEAGAGGMGGGGSGSDKAWDPRLIDCEGGTAGSVKVGKGKSTARGIRDIWKGFRRGGGVAAAADASPTPSPGSAQRDRGSTSYDSSTSTSESVTSPPPLGLGARPPRTPSPSKSNANANPTSTAMSRSRSISKFGSTSKPTGTVTAAATAENAVVSRKKQPLRRPSLAGIFGIGQKPSTASLKAHLGAGSGAGLQMMGDNDAKMMTERDESSSDWDRVDLSLDDEMNLDLGGGGRRTLRLPNAVQAAPSTTGADSGTNSKAASTIRLHPVPVHSAHWDSSSPEKPTHSHKPKLSLQPTRDPNPNYLFVSSSDDLSTPTSPTSSPLRRSASQSASRTFEAPVLAPLPSPRPTADLTAISLTRLALTPENIRPLLGHARDISTHLNECIGEVRGMMGGVAVV